MSAASSPMDLFDLTGRRAVVTGGSRGLGREIVLALAAQGADVAIVSRKLPACEELAAEVRERHGVRTLAIACNVSHWDQCDQLVDEVLGAWGTVDVLVNNAGMSPLYDTVDGISEALWDKVLGVNLKGPFRLAARFGAAMKAAGRGSIVNVSSLGAVRPTADVVPYAAAKAGLNNLTEGLAAALGPEVRVNCIMPGRFATDIAEHWDAEAVEAIVQGHALRRVAEPHEVVGAALYFASDASSFATGSILRLDGGVP
ncbi:MAG TPA: glucose 1-dehydrogenase [Iamia sp.]|nr:glucose 1-dehydrogenase [Iamia sp.]